MKKQTKNNKNGLRLKKCRKEKGYSQEKLAELSNYSVQTVSYIENGNRNMSRESAHTFAKILGIREEYLLGETDYPTPSDMYRAMMTEMQKKEQTYIDLMEKYGYKIIGTGETEWKNVNIFREHVEDGEKEEIIRRVAEAPYVKYVLLQSPNGSVKRMDLDRYKSLINDIEDYFIFQIERCFEQPQPFRTL